MMTHFTDRIFYLVKDDSFAHISYLTSGNWVLYLLEADTGWEWQVEGVFESYEQAFRPITFRDPNTLLQEEWA